MNMMNPVINTTSSWANMDSIDGSRRTYYSTAVLLLAIGMATYHALTRSKTNAPFLNPPRFFEFFATRRRLQAVHGIQSQLEDSYKAFPNKCFRIMTSFAEVIVLPSKYAHEIRNDERFDFRSFANQAFPREIHGMQPLRYRPGKLKEIAQRELTKKLNKVTQPLNEEMALAMSEILTESEDWHTVNLKDVALYLVTRTSSRVFLGEELCRDEKWIKVTREYSVAAFEAMEKMLVWPSPLRPIISRFLPTCRRAASLIKDARDCMAPVLERRQRERASGNYVPYDDAIEWFEASANGEKQDPVHAQLILSAAAIFTTTDLLSQTVGDLAVHQDFIEPLREEVVRHLVEDGWKKTTLYNMKLLDSCIKESQRMKPMSLLSMGRLVKTDVTLSDGTFIPKNSLTLVSSERMRDPTVYANPSQWDGARFFNKRKEPGQEQSSQLVSTGPDHLAFGHGQHACPGRFFASNEIKMALAHLLLKYDFRLHDRKPQTRIHGLSLKADSKLKLDVRRRREEIDLGSL
ncbi:hypothetical protein E4U21_003194 [Claviceps maximensis]|nr:hypothetical protein E4U21_003194 [Claviceps maximensis]